MRSRLNMTAWQLNSFGLENLKPAQITQAEHKSDEVLIKFEAASVNPRDYQIIEGLFTQNVNFPLTPLSDGAGVVVAAGDDVTGLEIGDTVTPLFFPNWKSGEALFDERKISSGLESEGVLRKSGVYNQNAVTKIPDYLTACEAACLPCAGLTAWTSLVPVGNIEPGNTVLVQGTGGVAIAALQLSKALGARVIIISSSDEKLARAKNMGADLCINYLRQPNWGSEAFEFTGGGVDAVIEIGGAGTMEQSLNAIRHGGHIAVIGYMAGIQLDVTVFPLIIKCANLHGIATGNRDNYEQMLTFMADHKVKPTISRLYSYDEAPIALGDIAKGGHFGKLVIDFAR
ncbi:MAG: NAD(P)-dependent alcohol dehydrogenase [Cellvibrionales bacterium TMED148]|nr:NAD(P)-dependent alcohol dehydrogenase [Porticoccaceae bacterium]RPG92843.1 MAG: NAD(P)-dependent alcohol dehydrogenase [Cellvibrionales bacterium TMED148]